MWREKALGARHKALGEVQRKLSRLIWEFAEGAPEMAEPSPG